MNGDVFRNDHIHFESILCSASDNNGLQTPPHQIISNTYNQEILINKNILRMSTKSLAKLDESK
ncbi:8369_t:CDS:2, partial [Diversispora eburnea]